jgi:hypothetical protein
MSQKFYRDDKNLLQPKICHGATQIYRPSQNKLLGLKKEMNSNKHETRDLIWSSLSPRKLRLFWGSHKGRVWQPAQ